MEKEDFENKNIADILNKYFVSIKVDREERPDIDSIYMNICQHLTGSGGWPLTIIMTPDQKPFFAGTYFPKDDLENILSYILNMWKNDKSRLIEESNNILEIANRTKQKSTEDIPSDILEKCFLGLKENFDAHYGGFGISPKFPSPHNLMFLLRYWYKTEDASAMKMLRKALDSMQCGGIYDHIGYGFSRYSVDRKWLVPHFEKMLYDNALLAIIYSEAYKATGDPSYSSTAKNILTYIMRDMMSKNGGFYSSEDADSGGKEGSFYIWTVDEIKAVLGEESGRKFCDYYNINEKGNFDGKNIPNLIGTSVKSSDMDFMENCRKKLFDYREGRIHPNKDDKILTSWNGLMIAAMSIAGRIFRDKKYISCAEKAVDFILNKLTRKDGRLLSRYRDGDSSFPGYADDYSFLIWGLIELYESTYNLKYIKKALDFNNDFFKFFWDHDKGGFFLYGSDSEHLITRPKEIYDGAIPSANSVSALNLIRLSYLTGNLELRQKGLQIFKCFSSEISTYPVSYCFSLIAFQFSQVSTRQIIAVLGKNNNGKNFLKNVLDCKLDPFTVSFIFSDYDRNLEHSFPLMKNYNLINGSTTVYICENFSCKKPITDLKLLDKML